MLLWDFYYALYSQYLTWLTDDQFFDLIDALTSVLNPWVSHRLPRSSSARGHVVMEKMPFRERPGLRVATPAAEAAVTSNWQKHLPVLSGAEVELRELRCSDAPSLFTMVTTDEVARFISPPPTTIEGFENFIAWAHQQRSAGAYACFAVTLKGYNDTAIGIFQVRELEPGFATAEWGFAIGSAFWGTGVFRASADLVLDFAFETLGVHRLEARAAVRNGRGTARAP